jgi:p-cymene monooxygenase electron transfer component
MSWLKSIFGGSGPRQVLMQPSGRRFEVPKGETVLERALKEGIAYPHDCTVGTCGSCRSRLIEGSVEAITPFGYTLSREELEAGYILACQAIPKSDLVLEVSAPERDMPAPGEYQARLIALDDLTHDIRRATFELDAPMRYVAGQYANFRWPGDPRGRSFSFASKPSPDGLTRISTFVRRVPGGAFTGHIFSDQAQDTPYVVDGPHGNFWLRDGTGPILCVAGGSGLAPIISLLEDATARGVRRDCILLFGARSTRDVYGSAEIAAIRESWPASFDYWPALSEEQLEGTRHGFVTAHIAPALERLGPGAQAYLCGPPVMIDAAVEALARHGIGLDDIHYDKFTDASAQPAAIA